MGQMRDIGHEIQEQVRSTLGLEFQVQSFDIRKGSVTLFVAVSTAFGFYMGFSRYESFIKSANLLVSQLKGIVQRGCGRRKGPRMQGGEVGMAADPQTWVGKIGVPVGVWLPS
jgi:hypothetical protein